MELPTLDRLADVTHRWKSLAVSVAILCFGISIVREFTQSGGPTPGADAAFFQHAGWYITQGAVPYVHIWDVKPPLTHLTTTGLAFISFGNMYVLHLLSVALMSVAGVATILLIAILTYRLTEDRVASLIASLCMLSFAGFHYHASQGFYPKYLALVMGLSGILLQFRGRPAYSGVAVALSAGYIQHGAVFSVLVFGLAFQHGGRQRVQATLIGIVTTTVIVVAPIIALGGGEAMVVETIVALLTASEPSGVLSILRRLGKGLLYTGYASIPVLLGVYGLIQIAPRNLPNTWWVLTGGCLYAAQIFLMDFDSYPDLFFGLAFVSLGIGLLLNSLNGRTRQAIVVIVASVVLMSVTALGGAGIVTNKTVYTDSLDDSLENSDTLLHSFVKYVEDQFGAESMRRDNIKTGVDQLRMRPSLNDLYWGKMIPESCHYRLSTTEILWIEQTDRPYIADSCGSW